MTEVVAFVAFLSNEIHEITLFAVYVETVVFALAEPRLLDLSVWRTFQTGSCLVPTWAETRWATFSIAWEAYTISLDGDDDDDEAPSFVDLGAGIHITALEEDSAAAPWCNSRHETDVHCSDIFENIYSNRLE